MRSCSTVLHVMILVLFLCLAGCHRAGPPGPERFVEHVKFDRARNAGEVQFDFQMIRVAGSRAAGVAPFYISSTEVTWEMLTDWVYCSDIEDVRRVAELIKQGLRPSPIYGDQAHWFQMHDRNNPAMGMSHLSAESYCKWLSEKTGRAYRLPTLAEWRHAAELGGGVPDAIDESVWHAGNSPMDELLIQTLTSPAGSKAPNRLGIHDMFGSVAEWVGQGDDPLVVVGGSINDPRSEITLDWQAEEDQELWNATYPMIPRSRFWYVDYYFTGIRLVCEAPSVVANPPTASE